MSLLIFSAIYVNSPSEGVIIGQVLRTVSSFLTHPALRILAMSVVLVVFVAHIVRGTLNRDFLSPFLYLVIAMTLWFGFTTGNTKVRLEYYPDTWNELSQNYSQLSLYLGEYEVPFFVGLTLNIAGAFQKLFMSFIDEIGSPLSRGKTFKEVGKAYAELLNSALKTRVEHPRAHFYFNTFTRQCIVPALNKIFTEWQVADIEQTEKSLYDFIKNSGVLKKIKVRIPRGNNVEYMSCDKLFEEIEDSMEIWTGAIFSPDPSNLPPNQFMYSQFLTKIDFAVPGATDEKIVLKTITISQILNEYLSAFTRAGSPFTLTGAKMAGTGEGISWGTAITNPKEVARLIATAVAKGIGEKILPELAKWFGIAFGEFFFRTFPYVFAFTFSLILLALPFIVLTMMLPEGLYVFVSYIRGLIWVMSWLPFAILVYHIGNLYYDSMLPATAVSALVQGGVATGEAFRQLTDDADLAMAMMGFFLSSIPFITYVIFAKGIIGELGTRIGGAVGSALGGAMATGYVVQRGLGMISRTFGGRGGAGRSAGASEGE